MKRTSIVLFALLLTSALVQTTQASVPGLKGFKVGGGILWNDRVAAPLDATGNGLHVSAEFELTRMVFLSPFYEFSRGNDLTSTLMGGEFHYVRGPFYLGPGVDIANAGGRTKIHLNGVGGLKLRLTSRIGFFVQGKYAWAADDLVKGVTAHAGATFPTFGK